MCLLDPLFAGFPPIKGCGEVYADKKAAAERKKFPLSGRHWLLCYLFVRIRSPLHILKVKIRGFLRFLENPGQFQGGLGD